MKARYTGAAISSTLCSGSTASIGAAGTARTALRLEFLLAVYHDMFLISHHFMRFDFERIDNLLSKHCMTYVDFHWDQDQTL